MTRLDILNHYNAYNFIACNRILSKEEKIFYDFCINCHYEIGDDLTKDDHPIIIRATSLYNEIDANKAIIGQAEYLINNFKNA
jgi:hypothetical protein